MRCKRRPASAASPCERTAPRENLTA
jgi:hypothetical protein